ncbi:MAG: hypothetical protein H6R11_396 [Proteobacteria bacterium]|jgi:hypothetical protein|nr:hypothetical protein [Pseudomonadota bacterium]MBS1171441.1 hypothetical protein [Pseudomonadota bacterium]
MENAAPPKALVKALRHVLYPLARVMLSKGITLPFLIELLKSVFVAVAEREFRIGNRPQTDSRISLLTGVHRKDIRRLRHLAHESGESTPAAVSFGSQLVAAWMGSPQYLNQEGHPLPLPRLASAAGELSFEGLVASVSKDIRSRAVLDEWLRLGVVHIDEEDRVILNTEAFVPQKGFEEKMFYFGHNLHDHIAAAAHNVLEDGPTFLERSVHYDALNDGSIADLAELAERAGMQAALTVNRKAMELEKRDAASTDPKRRITFGIYFFSGPTEADVKDAHE